MFAEEIIEERLRGITLVYGAAGSGKTTLCLQALSGRSVYISSSKNFSSERLQAMRTDAGEIMAKLMLFEPSDLLEWERAIEQAIKLSALSDILVLDSLATPLRLAPRKMANLALHRILQVLLNAKCPVLITSEVFERPEGNAEIQFIGGDMLRIASNTIIELKEGAAIVRKHSIHAGRAWNYSITAGGLVKSENF